MIALYPAKHRPHYTVHATQYIFILTNKLWFFLFHNTYFSKLAKYFPKLAKHISFQICRHVQESRCDQAACLSMPCHLLQSVQTANSNGYCKHPIFETYNWKWKERIYSLSDSLAQAFHLSLFKHTANLFTLIQ